MPVFNEIYNDRIDLAFELAFVDLFQFPRVVKMEAGDEKSGD